MSADQPFRVLVVEDNVIDRRVEVLLLKRAGVDADVAPCGEEAVEAQRLNAYDLILMDIQMPGMDGFGATRRIRELRQRQPVIIAVSANEFTGSGERCLSQGMDAYLSKPIRANN